jgi:mono/diheme cytochrome c family protein
VVALRPSVAWDALLVLRFLAALTEPLPQTKRHRLARLRQHAAIKCNGGEGRRGVMPAFDRKLKPEKIKAVSVYVLSGVGK